LRFYTAACRGAYIVTTPTLQVDRHHRHHRHHLEQITPSWRTKQRRIFVSGKERERRRSSATSSEQRHSQRQKDKSATAT
jgi:hypothetical protein